MKTSQFATLGEYRREVLRCPQSVVAQRAKVQQGWISQCELGHLPAPWKRDALLAAYKLTDKEFVRMVTNAAKMKALQHPMTETEPLLATAAATDLPALISGLTREAQQILIQQYEARRQA